MHCDSLRVFTRELQPQDGQSSAQRGIGLGLFMCGAVIALGLEAGCPKAEILAINDDGAPFTSLQYGAYTSDRLAFSHCRPSISGA